jgi:hypothetical protein
MPSSTQTLSDVSVIGTTMRVRLTASSDLAVAEINGEETGRESHELPPGREAVITQNCP